jgi:hypothetical protein
MNDEDFIKEKLMEMIIAFVSLFHFILLIPNMIDHFYDDKTIRERVELLEERILELERAIITMTKFETSIVDS